MNRFVYCREMDGEKAIVPFTAPMDKVGVVDAIKRLHDSLPKVSNEYRVHRIVVQSPIDRVVTIFPGLTLDVYELQVMVGVFPIIYKFRCPKILTVDEWFDEAGL